jgi:anti-sigma factor RsiW
MTHLGDRISAFVDGELDHDARDRVLGHLAQCRDCRNAAEEQRRLKVSVSAAVPGPSDALIRSLISMSEPGEPTPREHPPLAVGDRRMPSVATSRDGAVYRRRCGPGRVAPSPGRCVAGRCVIT